jgi:hypothetical protein
MSGVLHVIKLVGYSGARPMRVRRASQIHTRIRTNTTVQLSGPKDLPESVTGRQYLSECTPMVTFYGTTRRTPPGFLIVNRKLVEARSVERIGGKWLALKFDHRERQATRCKCELVQEGTEKKKSNEGRSAGAKRSNRIDNKYGWVSSPGG